MQNTCADCRHCGQDGYCEIWEKIVKPNGQCPEFEEH